MVKSPIVLKVGTRGSKLAVTQTRNALDNCEKLLPNVRFESIVIATPGDRDHETDLRVSPADFFSKDLDDALRGGAIDCALHSAKDLAQDTPAGIDRFWLPWREDPRDAIVVPPGAVTPSATTENLRIGVSSDRREEYCRKHYPQAELLSVRGNIEERLAQLDRGDYDVLIIAAAALHRLDLHDRIHAYIPLSDLQVPAGQGVLAVTFRQGDARFMALRNLLLHPVLLAGAGIGTPENITEAVSNALRHCDTCLHDSLLPEELLNKLPATALRIAVGKRSGRHSVSQNDICSLLIKFAKEGRRVVRLKGGDPTVFGRLAEETAVLQGEHLPFRVLPGIGALAVAAASTGILPSRREIARGYSVMTPRAAGVAEFAPLLPQERLQLPQIYYMATKVVAELSGQYLSEGFSPDMPVAVVFDAGDMQEEVIDGTLADIAGKLRAHSGNGPGLVVVGATAKPEYRFRTNAALENKRLLYCGAAVGTAKAREAVARWGGRFINLPLIELQVTAAARQVTPESSKYDYLLITSPSCARLFLHACAESAVDLRRLPGLIVCGPGTAEIFTAVGIYPDIIPTHDFGAKGLLQCLEKCDLRSRSILRLRSDKAGGTLAAALSEMGADVNDVVFYRNHVLRPGTLPDSDVVIFTSTSAAAAFIDNFGAAPLRSRLHCVIGTPTAEYLRSAVPEALILQAVTATLSGCVESVAGYFTALNINARRIEINANICNP